jgi:AGCS family alanine or glycine:cation symporter|tara:strand:+ start:58625 stop:59977 length:1353 start_codon:yes stop_codon:yes gene_type:complete
MFESVLGQLNGLVWGVPMLVLLLGTGIYLSVRLKGLTLRRIGSSFRELWAGRTGEGEGEIPPFRALMTSLSATIGTGNIAGVATAIGIGGPGALFWMWMTALLGMATKYSEAVLAVEYREKNDKGENVGGPMYYIRNGLGSKWSWMAVAFALMCGLGGFGIGNGVQANSVADALNLSFAVPELTTGLILAVLIALVIFGGVKRIAEVAAKLVPIMAIAYILCGLIVLALNATEVPAAFVTIVKSAFSPVAATGGFAGSSIMLAIRMGVARGVFSNEAGLGSAPIAHAAAQTDNPVRQGRIAMLGTFIDTILLCSITGLVIVVTGVWTGAEQGSAMTAAGFAAVLPGGDKIVTLGLAVFAFTTLLGWSYYSEKCFGFLFGIKALIPFRILWVLMIPIGATLNLEVIWDIADTMNGLMALPNLIALLLLSPVVFRLTRADASRDSATVTKAE